jgi:hypothetical protein
MRLGDLVLKVRSKNAGPFWLTVDIFCGDADRFARVSAALDTGEVARLFATPRQMLKRFDIADLAVVKISLPRPVVQGSRADRDMHGAQWAHLLEEIDV